MIAAACAAVRSSGRPLPMVVRPLYGLGRHVRRSQLVGGRVTFPQAVIVSRTFARRVVVFDLSPSVPPIVGCRRDRGPRVGDVVRVVAGGSRSAHVLHAEPWSRRPRTAASRCSCCRRRPRQAWRPCDRHGHGLWRSISSVPANRAGGGGCPMSLAHVYPVVSRMLPVAVSRGSPLTTIRARSAIEVEAAHWRCQLTSIRRARPRSRYARSQNSS